ncbi:MAG TPA: hypothetical protein VJ302_23610 [Blastocatellia bacterium]|nr:hypothetical protein [Blastocatellia bacterium]
MKNRVKRPPSVWITLILILLCMLPFLKGLVSSVLRCLIGGPEGCVTGIMILRWILVLGVTITLPLFAIWGLYQGKRYGQWLGIALLIVVTAVMIANPTSKMAYSYILSAGKVRQALPPEYYNFSNDAQRLSGAITTVSMQAGLIILILRLAFAKAARRYFQGEGPAASEPMNNSTV